MKNETILRDWFGAVRAAADDLLAARLESSLSSARWVKAQILLRQYMRDGLEERIAEAEGVGSGDAEAICRDIYSELMEDVLGGMVSEEDTIEVSMFLYECTNGVRDKEIFSSLLGRALEKDIVDEESAALMTQADREMERHTELRKAANMPQKEPERNEDTPPPWLDEFEYIDWVITH